jgi:hypothetical protein
LEDVSDSAPPAGLCNTCVHQQIVRNTRGSVFSLCRRSRAEPDRFPRYPRLPVSACPGYQPEERLPSDRR